MGLADEMGWWIEGFFVCDFDADVGDEDVGVVVLGQIFEWVRRGERAGVDVLNRADEAAGLSVVDGKLPNLIPDFWR